MISVQPTTTRCHSKTKSKYRGRCGHPYHITNYARRKLGHVSIRQLKRNERSKKSFRYSRKPCTTVHTGVFYQSRDFRKVISIACDAISIVDNGTRYQMFRLSSEICCHFIFYHKTYFLHFSTYFIFFFFLRHSAQVVIIIRERRSRRNNKYYINYN